jgi:hypothetical protein
VTRTTTKQLIAEQLPNLNSRKTTRLALKPKMDLKGNWSLKRLQAVRRGRLNPSFVFYTDINLTTSSDEGEQQEYLFTSSEPFSSSKIKLAKLSHPTTNHLVGSEHQASLSTMRNICSER